MSDKRKKVDQELAPSREIEELKATFAETANQLATDVSKFAAAQEASERARKEHHERQRRSDDVDDVIEACHELGHTARESGARIADALATMGASIREAGEEINDACQESSQTMRKFSKLLGDSLVGAAERAAESSDDE